ncbi:hypothetical protein [Coleofasciculus sp.]
MNPKFDEDKRQDGCIQDLRKIYPITFIIRLRGDEVLLFNP